MGNSGTYDFSAYGAQGGTSAANFAGGLGAEESGSITLSAGEHLEIIVGGKGKNANSKYEFGGGGGGGTFVLANNNGTYVPILVAGGGGGGYEGFKANGSAFTVSGQQGSGSGGGSYEQSGGGAGVKSSGKQKTPRLNMPA